MKNCKHCGAEVAKSAKVCPKCGGKLGKPKWLVFIVVLLVIIIIAVVSGGNDDNTSETEKFSYEVTKSYKDSYNVGYYIEGTVTNNKAKDYSYVQIEFVCYDKNGNNLGTAIDNTNNLLANQTWKFKAMAMFSDVKNVDRCDYHEITSW